MAWRPDQSDYDAADLILLDLRSNCWRVAAHNDYSDFYGRLMTFWLFTHPSGQWAKGESFSDQQALVIVRHQAQERERAASL